MLRLIATKVVELDNRTTEHTDKADDNFQAISSNWHTIRQAPANQEENETIPMLENSNMP